MGYKDDERKKTEPYKIGSMTFDEPNEYIAKAVREKQRQGGLKVEESYVVGSMKFQERDKGKGQLIKKQQEKGLDGNTTNMWADDSVKYDPTALSRKNAKPTAVPNTSKAHQMLSITPPEERVYDTTFGKQSQSRRQMLSITPPEEAPPKMSFWEYKAALGDDGNYVSKHEFDRMSDKDIMAALKINNDYKNMKYDGLNGKKLAGALGFGAEKTGTALFEPIEKALDFISAGVNTGISDALQLGSTLTAFGGEQNKVSTALQKASDFVDSAARKSLTDDVIGDWNKGVDKRYKPTDLQKNVANVTGTVTGMLPAIGLNFATGGGAGALSAGGALMGLSAAGGGASEAVREGADTDTALRYGTLSGATEVAIEKAFGGIPGLGEGVSDKTIKSAINKFLRNDFARKSVETFVDAAGEGAEEALSTALDPFLKQATYDKEAVGATGKEIGESAILGALSSLLLTGAFSVGDKLSGFKKPTSPPIVDVRENNISQPIAIDKPIDTSALQINGQEKESLSALPVTGLQLPEMIATKDPLYDSNIAGGTRKSIINAGGIDSDIDSLPTKNGQTAPSNSSIRQTTEKINGSNENVLSEQVNQMPNSALSPLLTDYSSQTANEVMKPLILNNTAHTSASIEDVEASMGENSTVGVDDGLAPQRQGQTAKTAEYQRRQENFLVKDISKIFGVPSNVSRQTLNPIVAEISQNIKNGKLDTAKADELFNKAYDDGIVVMQDFYEQYKELKTELRTQGVSISKQDKGDFDDWGSFKRRTFGSVKITDDGTPIDVKYDELSNRYPDLFSSNITHPADQLRKMVEVARSIKKTEIGLDEYYGEDAEQHKEYTRHEFNKRLDRHIGEIERVSFVENEVVGKTSEAEVHIATVDQLRTAYKAMEAAQKNANKVMAKMLLTKRESNIVDGLLKGTVLPQELANYEGINRNDIVAIYEAKKAVAEQKAIIDGHKNAKNAELFAKANELIKTSDQWQDKKMGILYSRETMDRNFEDITKKVKDDDGGKIGEQVARGINEYLWEPVQDNEAGSTRFKIDYSNRIRALKLNRHESVYTQMHGEWQYNSNYAKEHADNNNSHAKKAAETADMLAIKMDEFRKKHGEKIDYDKVDRAVSEFHDVYDEIFEMIETTLLKNGFKPPEYRGGYFPHFNDNLLIGTKWYSKAGIKLLNISGIKIKAAELPTDIAGLTHTFKPGKRWMGNLLERKGEATTYDATAGFDSYLENASDIIFHTEDIQRWRAFENAIRYKYSDDGVKEKYNEILAEDLDEAERHSRISALFEQDKSKLSHLVQEVRSYTDSLAGKKSIHDRTVEADTGRAIYQVIQQVESRTAANMIAGNLASAFTNGIAMTQASAELSSKSMLKAARDTLAAIKSDDGFIDRSNFLTNRRGYESTHRDTLEVIADKLSKPSYYIDFASANIITRARVYDNLKKGMTEGQAMAEADKYAARLMADRSKGALPTVFNRKNPAAKLFTMFQVEVNNQLSYLFKDLPKNMRERGKLALIGALMKYMLGSFAYNELYEKIVGRRPALDPIGMVREAFVAAKKDGNPMDGVVSLGASALENTPFVGGVLGGGRLPISAALPDVKNLLKLGDPEVSSAKRGEIAWKEGSKPLYYLGLPFGGGQAKKIVESSTSIPKGGSYTLSNEGEKQLQFPLDNTAANWSKGLLFGKYSTSNANDYVNKGFKPYSAKATEAFDILRDNGRKPTDATDVIDKINSFKGDGSSELKRDFLLNLDGVKPSDKRLIDDLIISDLTKKKDYSSLEAFNLSGYTDAQKEKYAQASESFDMDTTEFTEYSKAINNIDGDKDVDGKTIKGSAKKKKIDTLIEMGMTYDEAEEFYKAVSKKAD